MLNQIVGRCHVGDTHRQVIRYLISRLRHGYQGWRALEKAKRREVMRECIRLHNENRRIYRSVMSGTPSRKAR